MPRAQTFTEFSELARQLAAEGGTRVMQADARQIPLPDRTVDLVVTSPPYWKKRDYGVAGQIGQEDTPKQYGNALLECLQEWKRLLKPTGSVFLNIGDTYREGSLSGVPGRVEAAANDDGWLVKNRIIWAKEVGTPEPFRDKLVNRHEYILHLTLTKNCYYDIHGYSTRFGSGANPGDVWNIAFKRNMSNHLAPYPEEIVERAITLACPEQVCPQCGQPQRRIVRRTANLNPDRPQAKRAMELAAQHNLTPEHIAAIQATGISDAGKARQVQNGTGRNTQKVKELAAEAKAVLGGYFREFTFAQRETVGWTSCDCQVPTVPGIVLDPFMGSGTTLKVAQRMNRLAVGVDLVTNGEH